MAPDSGFLQPGMCYSCCPPAGNAMGQEKEEEGDALGQGGCRQVFQARGVALCVLYRHKNVVNAKGSKSNCKERNNSCFAQAEREDTVP